MRVAIIGAGADRLSAAYDLARAGLLAFALGAWSPVDPVSRWLFGTTSVGGETIYDTPAIQRGPDRIVVNFAVLRATRRLNAQLRQIYAADVVLVTGDCDTMKLGEKLYSVGLVPHAYAGALPGVRPLRCVPLRELPAGAAAGAQRIALVRTPRTRRPAAPYGSAGRRSSLSADAASGGPLEASGSLE
jgi:hypothetical protein